jgi:plastocyanin
MHVLSLLATALGVSAATIKITAQTSLKFDPDSVTASAGDVLEFHFQPQNHSVAMGEFDSINGPCVPSNTGGFFSGYMPTSSGENVRRPRMTAGF